MLSGADYAYLGWLDASRLRFRCTYGFMAREQNLGDYSLPVDAATGLTAAGAGRAAHDLRFRSGAVELENALPCRSYLGVPLIGPANRAIGTLAVLAIEAKRFSPEHVNLMNILARQAVTRLELYSRTAAQEHAQR